MRGESNLYGLQQFSTLKMALPVSHCEKKVKLKSSLITTRKETSEEEIYPPRATMTFNDKFIPKKINSG